MSTLSSLYSFAHGGEDRYEVRRRADGTFLGYAIRDDAGRTWTSVDLTDTEAWPFDSRESVARFLDYWHDEAERRLAREDAK